MKEEQPRKEAPFKPHPIHTQEFVDHLQRRPGGYLANRHRRTGRSTAQALGALSMAISRPGEEVVLRDHFGTAAADAHLALLVLDIIDRLGLVAMRVGKSETAENRHRMVVICGSADRG